MHDAVTPLLLLLLRQPLIPSQADQAAAGGRLPKPLLRYRDAEPLLEDDERHQHMPAEDRCVSGG